MSRTQQLVRLADLFEGRFVRAPGESAAEFEGRILEMSAAQGAADEEDTVLAYVGARARGAVFPPIFVAELGGEMHVLDGWKRCGAAAFLMRGAIRAVVFKAASFDDCDRLSELFFEFETTSAPWQQRVAAGEALQAA